MSYNLPTSGTYYRYLGVSNLTQNSLQMLVGVQTLKSSTTGLATGLCDYYYFTTTSNYTTTSYGVISGGSSHTSTAAGPFSFSVYTGLADTNVYVGFRLSLAP